MRILYVTPYVPSPIRIRPYNFIKGLARRGHGITLLTLAGEDEAADVAALAPYCQRIEAVPLGKAQVARAMLAALPGRLPLQAAYGRSRVAAARLGKLCAEAQQAGTPFDLAHVEHLRAAVLGAAIPALPRVYDAVDCISLLFERAGAASPELKTRLMARVDLGRTRRFEGRLLAQYEGTIVTSGDDRRALVDLAARYGTPPQPGRLRVVPNGIDLEYFAPLDLPREADTLVFSGKMSYHANIAAVDFLVREVLPLVWRERPGTRLWVVGKSPPPAISALAADPRITVTGYVDDLRPYLARAAVALTPIRYGVGIQNKVLEAMAMATPVVTTGQSAAALQAEAGRDLLVAETPGDLAAATLALLADAPRARAVGEAGRRYVAARHDWVSIAGDLEAFYAEVSAGGRHAP